MVDMKPTGSWKHSRAKRRRTERFQLRRVRANQSEQDWIGCTGGDVIVILGYINKTDLI